MLYMKEPQDHDTMKDTYDHCTYIKYTQGKDGITALELSAATATLGLN